MEGKSPTLEVREKNEGLNRIKQHMVVRVLSTEALSRAQGCKFWNPVFDFVYGPARPADTNNVPNWALESPSTFCTLTDSIFWKLKAMAVIQLLFLHNGTLTWLIMTNEYGGFKSLVNMVFMAFKPYSNQP